VREVPPGHTLTVADGSCRLRTYWTLDFPPNGAGEPADEESLVAGFRELLFDATRLRLRADVPVGAYLSGGLDSAVTTAVARRLHAGRLQTFSIAFEDEEFDEREFQAQMARHLEVEHQTIRCTDADIGRVFPSVLWHAEVPLLRRPEVLGALRAGPPGTLDRHRARNARRGP
jgi:asparagine synthase (glutamine-hydrolysing)